MIPAAQQKDCGHPFIPDESLIVDRESRLKNVVVALIDPIQDSPTAPEQIFVVLNQVGCHFQPHVVAVRKGTKVEIRNNDAGMHNVHIEAFKNPSINQSMPSRGHPLFWTAGEPEKVRVACDVHPWMNAWIAIIEGPHFAVTDDRGEFLMSDIPPGEHTLKLWHEKLGLAKTSVTVRVVEGEIAGVDISVGPLR